MKIIAVMNGDGWRLRQEAIRAARPSILEEYNVMKLFVRIAEQLFQGLRTQGHSIIYSERFWTEASNSYSPIHLRMRKLLGNANSTIDRFAY